MKSITKNTYTFLDHPVALCLIALLSIFVIGEFSIAIQLLAATGIAAFVLTLSKNHYLGVFKAISCNTFCRRFYCSYNTRNKSFYIFF